MDKKILGGIGIGVAIATIIIVLVLLPSDNQSPIQQTKNSLSISSNEKIGLVINTPSSTTTLHELSQVYSDAVSTGIGRSNVYLFWENIEPENDQFDWEQTDILMSLHKNNDLTVTLYFSIINGPTLGPFPNWIGNPPLKFIDQDKVVDVLDAILSRYDIIDTVIISGETDSQFRYNEQNIPVFVELFDGIYDKIKEKHPDVKIGNSFALHHVLNKELRHIVTELSLGDFVAFSYMPVDALNDITKTPKEAIDDLNVALELVPNKKIAFFEISWSTSNFVNGSEESQIEFMKELFQFYNENQSKIEFVTWYRQYDRQEGTCVTEKPIDIHEGSSVSVGGGSGLGSSEFIIERLDYYLCNSGLTSIDGSKKSSWNEFKNNIAAFN